MKMSRTALARHVTAVAVVLLTFAAKGPIERLVGPGPPLMFFMPAVTISAWQGGLGPGLLATALASAICVHNYLPPIGSLAIHNPNDIARLVAFVFDGILTSVLMEWLHRSRRLGACPNICSCSRMAAGFRWALAFSASAQPCARAVPLNLPRRCRSGARSSKDCGSSISVATRPTLSPGLATETYGFLART